MAIAKNGPNGQFVGRIGNLVYYMYKGKNVVRKIGTSTKPPTLLQLRYRMETKLCSKLINNLKDFIDTGFNTEAVLMEDNAFNQAVKQNKKQMFKGSYPNLEIAYDQVMLSKGLLKPGENIQVVQSPESIQFKWHADPDMLWAESIEQVMVLAYFPEEERSEYLLFGPTRSKESVLLEISPSLRGKYMETYLTFISANRKQVANSVYTGAFNKQQGSNLLLLR